MSAPILPNFDAIRFATQADEDELFQMVQDGLHLESGLRTSDDRPLPLSPRKVRETIRRATGENPYNCDAWIAIIGDPGNIFGSLYLAIEYPWYSESPVLMEIWNFVCPKFRKQTNNATTLIAFSKMFAEIMKMPLLMGITSLERTAAKERLYERSLGCRKSGSFYFYTPGTL